MKLGAKYRAVDYASIRRRFLQISIPRGSIKARLITIVVLSQTLLAAGLLLTGIFYTHQRLLSTLDAGMQARAMSLAALVRYLHRSILRIQICSPCGRNGRGF
jgi:hypothetical protein